MCAQFSLDPCFVVGLGLDSDVVCFGASGHDLAMSVVVDDRGDFCVAGDMFLAREPESSEMDAGERAREIPCYAVYLGDECWLEDGIGDAAEGGADVDGDDEGAGETRVGLAGVWSGHERGKNIYKGCILDATGHGTRRLSLPSFHRLLVSPGLPPPPRRRPAPHSARRPRSSAVFGVAGHGGWRHEA